MGNYRRVYESVWGKPVTPANQNVVYRRRPFAPLLIVGILFTASTTNSASDVGVHLYDDAALTAEEDILIDEVTSSGSDFELDVDYAKDLKELRLRTALTWDQLAEIFGVTRRSLHAWVNGGAMRPEYSQKLALALRFARHIDQGLPSLTKAALFVEPPNGQVPFKALIRGNFAAAMDGIRTVSSLNSRNSSFSPLPPPILRLGARPDDLVDVNHAPIEPDRPGRIVKLRKT
jgi:DNA-binding XRE family transcriptional regulator